jgi:hypothetical protein
MCSSGAGGRLAYEPDGSAATVGVGVFRADVVKERSLCDQLAWLNWLAKSCSSARPAEYRDVMLGWNLFDVLDLVRASLGIAIRAPARPPKPRRAT